MLKHYLTRLSYGLEKEMMPPMLDFVLNNYFPEIASLQKEQNMTKEDCYLAMFKEIVRRTASLIALWQCYGFCHGVRLLIFLSNPKNRFLIPII